MQKAAIIVPIYRNFLLPDEKTSLSRLFDIAKRYPIIFVKPESLDLSDILLKYPPFASESFSDSYFKDLVGYNGLMLSEIFYERFLDYEYILIYQLDAYIFRDELTEWCNMGYDYVGAPWIKRDVYDLFIMRAYLFLARNLNKIFGKRDRQQLFNKVGNGGFSLRKVKSHHNAALICRDEIAKLLPGKRHHLRNEDVFWSVYVNSYIEQPFIYPDYIEALQFSFDIQPKYCYRLNSNRLPFGCHAWSKKKMYKFWKRFIPEHYTTTGDKSADGNN